MAMSNIFLIDVDGAPTAINGVYKCYVGGDLYDIKLAWLDNINVRFDVDNPKARHIYVSFGKSFDYLVECGYLIDIENRVWAQTRNSRVYTSLTNFPIIFDKHNIKLFNKSAKEYLELIASNNEH